MGTHNLKQIWKSTHVITHVESYKENKWELRRDLETDKEGGHSSCTGKPFLHRGPTTEKTRPPAFLPRARDGQGVKVARS